MEEQILLAELTKNCDGKKKMLLDLLHAFDLACIGYDLQEARSKDIHNRVLREHEFFAKKDFSRWDPKFKIGDRVTDEEFLFLLSDEDFDRVMQLARPICVEEKLTDENGYYLENWGELRFKARQELVNFMIDEIIPVSLRHSFDVCRWNIVKSDKLIDAFRKCVKPAA